MKSGLILALVTAAMLLTGDAYAQGFGPYSGRGIPDSYSGNQEAKKSRWPSLFSRKEKSDSKSSAPFGGASTQKMPFQKYKPGTYNAENQEAKRSFADFFRRDPSRPSMLQRMNEKSKTMFRNTADWAQRTNQGIKDKSYETWNAITRRTREGFGRRSETTPARPPLRTTDSLEKPGIRY